MTRLDQAQTQFQGGLSVRMHASQTIVAGRRGLLTRVSAPLCTVIAGSMIALTVSSKVGRTTRFVSVALSFTTGSAGCVWHTFTFKHPLSVHVGQVLQLTIVRRRGEAPLWGANLEGGDPYRYGAGAWMGHTIQDFAFRTYVQG